MTPKELSAKWREDAATVERYGDAQLGKVLRGCADDLDGAMRSVEGEALSLREAALESGYSVDRLGHMIAEGKLDNAGKKGSPRIRRGDLPLKRSATCNRFDAGSAARDALRGNQ